MAAGVVRFVVTRCNVTECFTGYDVTHSFFFQIFLMFSQVWGWTPDWAPGCLSEYAVLHADHVSVWSYSMCWWERKLEEKTTRSKDLFFLNSHAVKSRKKAALD